MIVFALIALVAGVLCAQFWFSLELCAAMDPFSDIMLAALVFTVGIDIGQNREVLAGLKKIGFRVLLVPAAEIIGTLLPGTLLGIALGFQANVAAGISSGFGWYSLSAVMLSDMVSPQIGTISFLSNIFREVIAILTIPLIAKYLGKYTAIAPAGATSMDTTLSVVKKYTNDEVAVVSILNGVILTALVPVLVTLFCG